MSRAAAGRPAYVAAGVDLEAADELIDGLRQALSDHMADLLGMTGFAAAVELPAGYNRPVLVSATDGVGTKTEIARALGRYDTIGQDLVAMCADDVVCHGARPLFFLDYVAVGSVTRTPVASLVAGIAAACEQVGCSLIGGETAEHPGVMAPDQFDLGGFCVGIVERDRLLDRSAARSGDAVIGLGSSGLHSNGFSLVRAMLSDGRLDLAEPFGSHTMGEALLEPTRLYAADMLALLERAQAGGWRVRSLAHITGGGLHNLMRAVPDTLGVEVDPRSWPVPPIIALAAERADLPGDEMRTTFNAGIGMAVIVEPDAASLALDALAERGLPAWRIGTVRPAAELGARYSEVG